MVVSVEYFLLLKENIVNSTLDYEGYNELWQFAESTRYQQPTY